MIGFCRQSEVFPEQFYSRQGHCPLEFRFQVTAYNIVFEEIKKAHLNLKHRISLDILHHAS